MAGVSAMAHTGECNKTEVRMLRPEADEGLKADMKHAVIAFQLSARAWSTRRISDR